MVDTIILKIPRNQYKILTPDAFKPSYNLALSAVGHLIACKMNHSSEDKRNGVYRPRLTAIRRMTAKGLEIPLKIEFSAPKLLFGNNLAEVSLSDLEKITDVLQKKLADVGVVISRENIENAEVIGFHPSKNFEITEGYSISGILNEISKIPVPKGFDISKTTFINEGQSLQFYSNKTSVVFYDKMKDVLKPEKRAIDKDQNSLNKSIFSLCGNCKNYFDKKILRMEIRASNKAGIFKFLSITKERDEGVSAVKKGVIFREIFETNMCKKILVSYWNNLLANYGFIFNLECNFQKIFSEIIKDRGSPKRAIYLVGLYALAQSPEGISGFKELVKSNACLKTWYRIRSEFDEIPKPRYFQGWINQINNQLNNLE